MLHYDYFKTITFYYDEIPSVLILALHFNPNLNQQKWSTEYIKIQSLTHKRRIQHYILFKLILLKLYELSWNVSWLQFTNNLSGIHREKFNNTLIKNEVIKKQILLPRRSFLHSIAAHNTSIQQKLYQPVDKTMLVL